MHRGGGWVEQNAARCQLAVAVGKLPDWLVEGRPLAMTFVRRAFLERLGMAATAVPFADGGRLGEFAQPATLFPYVDGLTMMGPPADARRTGRTAVFFQMQGDGEAGGGCIGAESMRVASRTTLPSVAKSNGGLPPKRETASLQPLHAFGPANGHHPLS